MLFPWVGVPMVLYYWLLDLLGHQRPAPQD